VEIGIWCQFTVSEPWVLLSKMWNSGREVLSKHDRRRHQHKVGERESKSPCRHMQFCLSATHMKSLDYYEAKENTHTHTHTSVSQ